MTDQLLKFKTKIAQLPSVDFPGIPSTKSAFIMDFFSRTDFSLQFDRILEATFHRLRLCYNPRCHNNQCINRLLIVYYAASGRY